MGIQRLYLLGLPLLLVCAVLLRGFIAQWAQGIPGCIFYQQLGLLCPSCGNTRSVLFLLHGDVFSSLRYNALPAFGLLLALGFYVEVLAGFLGKGVVLIPRGLVFWVLVLIGFLAYFVLRNLVN